MKYLELLAKTPNNSQSRHDYGWAPYFLGLTSALVYPFTWLYCNQENLSIGENTLVRGLANCLCHLTLCWITSSPLHLSNKQSYKLLILRSVIMTIYSMVISLSQFILPLPIVHTINSSGVIFVFIIDYLVNGVQVNKMQKIGIFAGLIGVLIVGNQKYLRQIMGFGSSVQQNSKQNSHFSNYITDDALVMSGFTVFYMLTMVCWGYGVTLTKHIKANTFQINFIMGLIIQMFGGILYPYSFTSSDQNQSTPPDKLFKAFILTGIPITFTQTIFIASLIMSENAGMISMINFLSVAVSYGISIFRYNERVQVVGVIGVALTFYGVWKTITSSSSWIEIRQKKAINQQIQSSKLRKADEIIKS